MKISINAPLFRNEFLAELNQNERKMLDPLTNACEDATPLAIFAFNRPAHLRNTLQSLMACDGFDERAVTVFIDGPRNQQETRQVEIVRETAREMLGPHVRIISQEHNIGLAESITFGVKSILTENDKIIVVEDDFEISPIFLRFMDAALKRYRDQDDVYQISGHMFDVPEFQDETSAIFLPFTTTWGWGTWRRAWEAYDPTASGWEDLFSDRKLRRRFDLGGCYPYSQMLKRQQNCLSDSWGIRWYWSVFKRNGKCLFPPSSLVSNTGQDGSGTHGGGVAGDFSNKGVKLTQTIPTLPDKEAVSELDLAKVQDAIWRQNGGWFGWTKAKIQGLLRQ